MLIVGLMLVITGAFDIASINPDDLSALFASWSDLVRATIQRGAGALPTLQVAVDGALPDGLKTRHWMTLSALHHSGPRSQQAVADKLQIDKGTMVAVVNELEARGDVTRDRDRANKRNCRVQVAETGATWLTTAEAAIGDVEDDALASCPTPTVHSACGSPRSSSKPDRRLRPDRDRRATGPR